MTKNIDELIPIVEGVLFAASEPLTADAISKLFIDEVKPKAQDIKKVLAQLKNTYQDRGIELVEVATGFRFQVSQKVVPYIAKTIEEKPARYSRALLETLALIAYRQPITRGEIEDIRGVVVSSNIIKTLDEQGWIRVVGYKEVPGKPGLYATTKAFLDHFGLKSLEDLPPLAQLQDFDAFGPEQESDVSQEENQLELNIDESLESMTEKAEEEIAEEDSNDEIEDNEEIDEIEELDDIEDLEDEHENDDDFDNVQDSEECVELENREKTDDALA